VGKMKKLVWEKKENVMKAFYSADKQSKQQQAYDDRGV
jgi:hypothetical protein